MIKVVVVCLVWGAMAVAQNQTPPDTITHQNVVGAERIIGLKFTDAKRDSMLDGLKDHLTNYENIRKVHLPNDVPPAILFNPIPAGMKFDTEKKPFTLGTGEAVTMPSHYQDIAFYSIGQLTQLIKSRRITSQQLTELYIARLKKYGPRLHCVVTLMESTAISQAMRADRELASGKYRGPLHGIPYGAKDLLAARGAPTTWGSVPYKNQIISENATVISRLEDAGAVLVAKLSMGELAMGDVWFGGMTRSPWDTSKGSSGSSAGPAAATAAGLVTFAIGTETWGSIVSPSSVCATTGLRPTYGRVSRTGAMALSWSMDKIGPICRSAEDCAIVFNAIYGPDGKDQTLYDLPFNYDPAIDLTKLKVGYLKNDFDSVKENKASNAAAFEVFRSLGMKLVPIKLPKYPVNDLAIILSAEAGAAFDELTRSGKDDLLVRQVKDAWPNALRLSRFIPAVEYIQANRVRYLLVRDMDKLMNEVDVYLAPPEQGDNLLLTNLTGHPCVVLPNGFSKVGIPSSITLIGKLFDEATLLAVAKAFQDATEFHLRHPRLD